MSFKMLDVSSNNHPEGKPIDWQQVANDGYRAVMIKCTEGLTYANPWLARDAHSALAAGLHVGYYHYAIPAIGEAESQADYAIDAIAGLPRDIGLALDLEEANGLAWPDLGTFGDNFLARVAAQNIGSPLYCNPDWLRQLSGAPWGHKLWLASWDRRPRRQCWAWQAGQDRIPGVPNLVDVGIYFG